MTIQASKVLSYLILEGLSLQVKEFSFTGDLVREDVIPETSKPYSQLLSLIPKLS